MMPPLMTGRAVKSPGLYGAFGIQPENFLIFMQIWTFFCFNFFEFMHFALCLTLTGLDKDSPFGDAMEHPFQMIKYMMQIISKLTKDSPYLTNV